MQIQNHCELQKIRNYCYLYFYFTRVFQRQISYTEMTNVTARNVRKSHEYAIFPHKPQSARSLTVLDIRPWRNPPKIRTASPKYWGQFNNPRHNIECVSAAVPWVPQLSLTGCPGGCRPVMQ